MTAGAGLGTAASGLIRELMKRSAARLGTREVMVWRHDPDEDVLTPVLGIGEQAEKFIGKFRQPVSEGIISLTLMSGQASCHNDLQSHPDHSKKLDREIGQTTYGMIAAPLMVQSGAIGVISAVRLGADEEEFSTAHLVEIEFLAGCIAPLLALAMEGK